MNQFEWTIYASRRMHSETWRFDWTPDGWNFHAPGRPAPFLIQPNGEPISKNRSESLTYVLVNEAINYPKALSLALEALWNARKEDPDQDLTEPAEQLRAWIIATPNDPVFKGII